MRGSSKLGKTRSSMRVELRTTMILQMVPMTLPSLIHVLDLQRDSLTRDAVNLIWCCMPSFA